MTEVCLIGASLETDNRGVSALAAGASKLIAKSLNSSRITILVFARTAPGYRFIIGPYGPMRVDIVSYRRGLSGGLAHSAVFALICATLTRVLPFARLRTAVTVRVPMLRALQAADLVADLFGGDSFTDNYGLVRFVTLCIPRWCALLLRKKYVLLPQTYGPFNTQVGQFLAKILVRRASVVFSRTARDDVLDQWSPILASAPVYCPDVAFALDRDPASATLIRGHIEGNVVIVGVNINGLLYNGGYTRQNMFDLKMDYKQFVIDLVTALSALESVRTVLVPHTYNVTNLDDVENDLAACLDVALQFDGDSGRVQVIQESLDQHQIKGVIGGCDFFVGSRLHSCIAALSLGIVTVGVGYSKKFDELFSTLGMSDLVIDGRTTDHATALSSTLHHLYSRSVYVPRLQSALSHQRASLQESFEVIREKFSFQSGVRQVEAAGSTRPPLHG